MEGAGWSRIHEMRRRTSHTGWVRPCIAFMRSNERKGSPLTRVTLRDPWSGKTGRATLSPSSRWRRAVWRPTKSMNGYPVQKPWRAMTHGRGPPEWRTTAADAVWFGPNDAQRSLPGSPCRGTNSLGNESRSYAIPSAHPRPMSGAPATRAGGWRWYDAGWAIQPRRTYMARAAALSLIHISEPTRLGM